MYSRTYLSRVNLFRGSCGVPEPVSGFLWLRSGREIFCACADVGRCRCFRRYFCRCRCRCFRDHISVIADMVSQRFFKLVVIRSKPSRGTQHLKLNENPSESFSKQDIVVFLLDPSFRLFSLHEMLTKE